MFPEQFKNLSDQERHDYILKTFILNQEHKARHYKRDIDVIKEHHRFLWDADDTPDADSWEVRLARRYYDKLFKEYCIADLSRHKENKVALRWRTEAEVIAGNGQFQCGSRKCSAREELRSWEVNFAYQEHGVRKNALVKLRLCPEHSTQLNYTSRKREVKRLKRADKAREKDNKNSRQKGKASKTRKQKTDGEATEDIAQTSVGEQGIMHEGDELPITNESEKEDDQGGDIWSRNPEIEAEQVSRETDFERYLEDLLL